YVDPKSHAVVTQSEDSLVGDNQRQNVGTLRKVFSNLSAAGALSRTLQDQIIRGIESVIGPLPGTMKTPILYRPSAIAVIENDIPELVRYAVADAGLVE